MKAITWVLGLLLLIVLGKAALIWSGAYNIAADEPHWRLTERVMETLRDRSVAVRASSIVEPRSQRRVIDPRRRRKLRGDVRRLPLAARSGED